MLNSLIREAGYRSQRLNMHKDDHGEYEWVELETFDGGKKRIKKYKDSNAV